MSVEPRGESPARTQCAATSCGLCADLNGRLKPRHSSLSASVGHRLQRMASIGWLSAPAEKQGSNFRLMRTCSDMLAATSLPAMDTTQDQFKIISVTEISSIRF